MLWTEAMMGVSTDYTFMADLGVYPVHGLDRVLQQSLQDRPLQPKEVCDCISQ